MPYRYTTAPPYRVSHISRSTYNGEGLHKAGKARHAEAVAGHVEQTGVERAPAADRVTSQHARTVSVRGKQRVQQTAQVLVVTATEHRRRATSQLAASGARDAECGDGNRSGRPAPIAGRVGSTLGDRCVTGRPHKMQKDTFSRTNLKLKCIYYKVCDFFID